MPDKSFSIEQAILLARVSTDALDESCGNVGLTTVIQVADDLSKASPTMALNYLNHALGFCDTGERRTILKQKVEALDLKYSN